MNVIVESSVDKLVVEEDVIWVAVVVVEDCVSSVTSQDVSLFESKNILCDNLLFLSIP